MALVNLSAVAAPAGRWPVVLGAGGWRIKLHEASVTGWKVILTVVGHLCLAVVTASRLPSRFGNRSADDGTKMNRRPAGLSMIKVRRASTTY